MGSPYGGPGAGHRRASHGRAAAAWTIAVVGDKPDFREKLRSLSEGAGLRVVGECADERNALALLRSIKPAIAMVDVQFPALNGIEIIRRMHQESPQIRFIALAGHPLDEMLDDAMISGISAFVVKTDLIHEFPRVIDTISRGYRYISTVAQERLLDRYVEMVRPILEENALTVQQSQVAGLVARGLSNKEVASELKISESTVEKHRAAAIHRLGLQSSAELVRYALDTGLLGLKTGSAYRKRR